MLSKKKIHQFSNEEKWVINCIQGKISAISDLNFEIIHSFAKKNGLAPYLYFQIKKHNIEISNELERALKKEYLASVMRNTKIITVWKEINILLRNINIQAIPLKGIFLAQYIYPEVSLRPMSDIDILFSKEEVIVAFDTLLKAGAKIIYEEETEHDKKTGHHLPGINFKGILIEVHKSLFPLDTNYQLPLKDILSNLVWHKNTITLNPIENLIYLCLHAYTTMQRGGIRLSWFLDLILLDQSEHFKKATTNFKEIISQYNVEKPVLEVLSKAEFTFNYRFSFLLDKERKPLNNKEINSYISFVKSSDQQKTSYSYRIAVERLKNTKGLKNKISFAKSVITSKRDAGHASFSKRILTLTYRSLEMIFSKKKL